MPRTFMKLLLIVCIIPAIVSAGAYAKEARDLLNAGVKPSKVPLVAAVRLFNDCRRAWDAGFNLEVHSRTGLERTRGQTTPARQYPSK